MDFKQHVTHPNHNRGHTLDLVITYDLAACVSSVIDLVFSAFFNITIFSQQVARVRTVRKRYLSSEAAANFMEILHNTPAEILPASCDFVVVHFNSRLRSALDKVSPLSNKTIKNNNSTPWKNDKIKHLRKICRRAERKWRKTKLTVHYEILCEQLRSYNSAVKLARIFYFANLITVNKNNPKILFSTIDLIMNKNNNKKKPPGHHLLHYVRTLQATSKAKLM